MKCWSKNVPNSLVQIGEIVLYRLYFICDFTRITGVCNKWDKNLGKKVGSLPNGKWPIRSWIKWTPIMTLDNYYLLSSIRYWIIDSVVIIFHHFGVNSSTKWRISPLEWQPTVIRVCSLSRLPLQWRYQLVSFIFPNIVSPTAFFHKSSLPYDKIEGCLQRMHDSNEKFTWAGDPRCVTV